MWGPRSIAKLVHITPVTIIYGTQITIVFMGFINQFMTSWGLDHHSYSGCQNYRTEPGVQKYGKIPYLCTPPGSDSARSREI